MNLFPKQIKLFGIQKSISEILNGERSTIEWENGWLDFISEWYNQYDFIDVNTSGSTGSPKTIRLKKDFVAASALRTIRFFGLKPRDKVLHCLPSKYIAGKLMVVRALIGELDLYVVDPATDFNFLADLHYKFAAMVPNQVTKMLCLERAPGNLDSLLIGGSAMPQKLEDKLKDVPTRCYSSYAMTETATHIALRSLNGKQKDDYYQCLDGIVVSLSEEGCLKIKMPGLEGELLQTNDLAELKDERTFKILGRADNVIISGGIKFNPEQIEKKLEPYILQPFIISSLPHEKLGRQLILIIEGSESNLDLGKLQTVFESQLEKYECPRKIRCVDLIPRTPNGKYKRDAYFG
ncbi:AMP-binding protein [Sunxiuqinia sp. A32]|uniref:AMP-binding protein n=1 Tax=Sunxiuqinia sp. A32 TaxID=3461496 RepID=UPI004045481B